MNWCKDHWALLRKAIAERGLDKFGAQNSEQVVAEIESQLEGSPEAFDPLLGSWSRINMKMLESPGLRGRLLECPLCILVTDGQPHLVEGWVNGVTDEALAYAVQKGLVQRQ